MIPSTTNKLLISEDWRKIYQSYRNADFKSYDFETLRRTMIAYLQENYPEDFNDYIDSSEYIALIDLIAYLGQNLSFRIDLNARENFLETAERRDSILRLARLISYNAKRNTAANGFLKILSISTTDNVTDANGLNLANQTISWNDPTNSNWYQQFISIINAAMPTSTVVGRPYDSAIINGITHEQYRINSSTTGIPVYGFSSSVNGINMNFEIVSSLFSNSTYVYEEPPQPANKFSFIFKNDNRGNGSANTGFFVHFRQGALSSVPFTIDRAVPNEIISINTPDINNTDVWLWQLTSAGAYSDIWTKVSDLVGNNSIYNSLSKNVKNIYSVMTRENDQIDLNFSDGSFGNLPKGQFVLHYRQSNGTYYTIRPEQISNIRVTIPYVNKAGQNSTLVISASLQETVSNSTTSETNADIKTKAPQNYYTQNRMITGEDYNVAPLAFGNDILKIKSINRASSGISKYFELSDVSGKYSNTNIFADDGILYKQYPNNGFEFNFVNQNDISGVIKNQLAPIVDSYEMRNFYLDKYSYISVDDKIFSWNKAQQTTNQNNGYFQFDSSPTPVGNYTEYILKNITPGAMIKFVSPTGYYFLPNNEITGTEDVSTKKYIWVKVVSTIGDGTNDGLGLLDNGLGPVVLTGNVPTGAVVSSIIPRFANVLGLGIEAAIINNCLSKKNLGLGFDNQTRSWYVITASNLDLTTSFSLFFQRDITNVGKDNSWLISFEWTGQNYKVRYRTLEYIFESEKETAFFIDKSKKNYDFINDTVVKDQIKVLSINQYLSPDITTTNFSVRSTTTTSTVYNTNTVIKSFINTFTTNISVTTSTTLISNIITLQLQSQANSFTNYLFFNSVGSITTGSYLALHPAINAKSPYTTGTSITTGTSGTFILLASTLSQNIATGSVIVFVPTTVTNTTTVAVKFTATNTITNTTTFANTITYINTFSFVNTFTFTPSAAVHNYSLSKDYQWQIDSAVVESDGYINPKKIKISFFDFDDDGQLDDPDAFANIVSPAFTSSQTTYLSEYVYFKTMSDGLRYELATENILAYPNENAVSSTVNGQLYYFYQSDIDVIKMWNSTINEYSLVPEYRARSGRKNIKFQYIHNSGQERRIDPSKTNLIEIYLLTKTYDTEYRNWLSTREGTEPTAPTSQYLEESFSYSLEPIKSISDEIIFQPSSYKVLFGDIANTALQATFKAVRNSAKTASDNDIKTRILMAIEEFFNVDNWDFGQSFYFSELSTYVMNELTPDITNFIIVPKITGSFGSLYEITCQSNEIFINGATVYDIEVIDSITASQLKASSSVVTSATGN